jgi:hypothetical protein
MKKKFLNIVWVVLFFITNIERLWAESLPPAPSNFPIDPDGTGDESAAIDNTVILLVLAGIIWSFLFFRNTLKKQTVTN